MWRDLPFNAFEHFILDIFEVNSVYFKMSKSLGNVVNPLDLIKTYGVDSVRYFLMRDMVLGQDANFSLDAFIRRYNSDLANDLGNLAGRIHTLISKHFENKIGKRLDILLFAAISWDSS